MFISKKPIIGIIKLAGIISTESRLGGRGGLNLNDLSDSITKAFSFKNMKGEQKFLRFEGEGICVTLDFTNKNKNLNFLNKIDFLCIKYGVIPSLIKDSRISKKIFNKCFSESNLFRKKLYKFDKKRVYQSEVSRKLKI